MSLDVRIQEAFPRYPYSLVSLRRTLWYLFTGVGRVGLSVAVLVITVAYVILFHGLKTEENHLFMHRGIWPTFLCVSFVCCYYLVKLLYSFRLKLLYEQCQRCGTAIMLTVMFVLLCSGTLSSYKVFHEVQLANAHNSSISWMWSHVFNSTIFFVVLQRLLCTIFICIVLPVTKRWVREMEPTMKTTVLELLPWTITMLLHCDYPLSSLEIRLDTFIMGFGFPVFFHVWLLYLTLYVAYDLAFPCKSEHWRQGKKEMARLQRTWINYPPKSEVVTGLSPRHYALRYKAFLANEEQEKEMKTLKRTNFMAHEHYRIVFSELE